MNAQHETLNPEKDSGQAAQRSRGRGLATTTARGPRALQFGGSTAIHPESFRGRERRGYKERIVDGTALTERGYGRQRGLYTFLRNEPNLFSRTFLCIACIYRKLCSLQQRLQMGSFRENEPNFGGSKYSGKGVFWENEAKHSWKHGGPFGLTQGRRRPPLQGGEGRSRDRNVAPTFRQWVIIWDGHDGARPSIYERGGAIS